MMISPRELRDLEALLDAPRGPKPKIATEFDAFDAYCDAVERLLKINNIDGKEARDGYGLSSCYDAWAAKFSPEEYASGRRVE